MTVYAQLEAYLWRVLKGEAWRLMEALATHLEISYRDQTDEDEALSRQTEGRGEIFFEGLSELLEDVFPGDAPFHEHLATLTVICWHLVSEARNRLEEVEVPYEARSRERGEQAVLRTVRVGAEGLVGGPLLDAGSPGNDALLALSTALSAAASGLG